MPVEPNSNWLAEKMKKVAREDLARNIHKRHINTKMEQAGARPMEDYQGLMPAAGMTRFVKAGVPQVAERMGATKQFLEAMKNLGPKAEEAAGLFAERYPRIAAHMDIQGMVKKGTKGLTHLNEISAPKTKVQLNTSPEYAGELENTLLHEGTHVAQGLGRPNAANLYYEADKVLTPRVGVKAAYELNPFEQSARRVAERKLGSALPPIQAIKELEKLVEKLPMGSPDRMQLAALLRR